MNVCNNYGDYSGYNVAQNVEILEKEQATSGHDEVEETQPSHKRQQESAEETLAPAKKRNIAKVQPQTEKVLRP